jgi:serine/threonine-protein kinase
MERIGEYLVQRQLGEGGMGKVYEAEERLSKRKVALKVLRQELARSDEGRRLFLNEMTILAHLDHPNIVRCLACTETEGQLVMALELLSGRTLRDLLSEHGAFGWEDAVGVTVQIASALAAAHRQEPPIVHRDLKPENVMVLEDGKVKVMDFGIAKVLQALSKTTTHSVGTLQYMSPEQIDASKVDARSDLYNLGLCLYEMLVGSPPFESASPRELLNMQCTNSPPALPDDVRATVPRGVERLLFELLEKNPDDRPGTAADVLHDLEPLAPAEISPPKGGVRRTRTSAVGAASNKTFAEATRTAFERAHTEHATPGPGSGDTTQSSQPRADTIALVERASAPREISTKIGVAVILALTLVAGIITYVVRVASRSAPAELPAATAGETRAP